MKSFGTDGIVVVCGAIVATLTVVVSNWQQFGAAM
jgi:hypothetical protein